MLVAQANKQMVQKGFAIKYDYLQNSVKTMR